MCCQCMPLTDRRRRLRMADHAVVIAGGGPTGMMLAGELALAGTDVVVVEPRATQDLDGSRAGGLHSRTIEVLDQRGIARTLPLRGEDQCRMPGVRHQRLPDAPQLPPRALAERLRAHPRGAGSTSSASRFFAAARWRASAERNGRRGGAVRWLVDRARSISSGATGVAAGPPDEWHRLPGLGRVRRAG